MMWLGDIALYNQYTESTGSGNLYMEQRQNDMDKISVKGDIILHCHMCNRPIQSM